jgi:branched-chain amino acid transport system substrate-binding protein
MQRWLLAYTVAIGLSAPGAAGGAEPCPSPCSDAAITIAVVAPTSGQQAAIAFGGQVAKPVSLAVGDINAAGGILGRQLEHRVSDDKCDPGFALEAANRHVDHEKLAAVIGPICPAAALAVAPVYGRAGVPELFPTVSTQILETVRPKLSNIFSLIPTDEQEARALAAHLEREHKGHNVTLVYLDRSYRRGIIDAVKSALSAELQKSVRFEPLLDISGLYDRLADQLQRQQPDVIYLALDHGPLLQLLAKLRQRSLKAFLVGGHHLLSYSFWLDAKALSDGIHVIAPVGLPSTPEFEVVLKRISESGAIPDLVALNSYASVQIWAEAVRRGGSIEPGKVAEMIRHGEFATAVGPVAFDSNGNRRNLRYSFLTWQLGRPRFVARLPWTIP